MSRRDGYDESSCGGVSHAHTNMRIKLSSTLVGTAVLAITLGTGDSGRAADDATRPGEPACTALATAQFATVAALSTTYETGSAAQPPHCIVRGSAARHTG